MQRRRKITDKSVTRNSAALNADEIFRRIEAGMDAFAARKEQTAYMLAGTVQAVASR